MSDAAGRHDRARDLLAPNRSGDADGVGRRPVDPSCLLHPLLPAGRPGPGDS